MYPNPVSNGKVYITSKNDLDKDASYDYEITNTIDICAAYDKKGEYSKSIKLLEQIVKKGDFNNYPKLKYSVYGNLAYFLMKNKQYALSKNYFKEALTAAKPSLPSKVFTPINHLSNAAGFFCK